MMKFFVENLVSHSRLYPSNENKLFPVSNLFDHRRSKVFRSTANNVNITFDFQEKNFVETIILVPSKMDFFGFSRAFILLDEHGDFTSPLISREVEIFDKAGIATVTIPKTEARFARLYLESTLGYCELSKIFIGEPLNLGEQNGVDHGWGFTIGDLSTVTKNQSGQIFVDKMPRQKKLDFKFTTMIEEELNVLTDMTDRIGVTKPFFVLIDNRNEDQKKHRRSGMYRLVVVPEEANKFHGLYDMSFRAEEVM